MVDSGDSYFIDCPKCHRWYKASCHWQRIYDKLTYVHRNQFGNEVESVTAMFPRIQISNIEPHQCDNRKKKDYEV